MHTIVSIHHRLSVCDVATYWHGFARIVIDTTIGVGATQMRSASASTLPPPPVTDSLVEPDEQWKADLRRRIELGLRHMVEDAQTIRDTILSSQPSESGRERAQREYEESMNAIRMLAQEEFNRELRIEMSERKWARDVIDLNSPDVTRQQQWILDNIRKADGDRTPSVNSDTPQNAEGVLSTSRGRESLEDGCRSARPEDEGSGSDQSMESEEGEEEAGGGDVKLRQSRPTSRPNVPLTQPLRSRSPVSRRDAQSRWGLPPNLRSAEDHDEDTGDSPAPAHPAPPREGQPFSPGGLSRPQSSSPPVWSRVATPSRPTGISRASDHAKRQMYSPGPKYGVTGPHRTETPSVPPRISRASAHASGQMYSSGTDSSDTGLHRAGSLTSDQHRSSSVVPRNPDNGTERPPTQARDRIASSIGPRERQMSASASPHDRPSTPTYPAVAPRAIPSARPSPLGDAVRFPTSASPGSRALFSMQRSPEDTRQGIAIPRVPTMPEEGPR